MSDSPIQIRLVEPADLPALRRITVEGFEGTAIDQAVERELGVLAGHDWRWRKARHVDEDVAANPTGVFVAVDGETVLGYISTRLDHEAGKGRIPNLAVDRRRQGEGIGRRLIEHALDYFRREGMAFVMIETMANNEVGQHLYPSCGFVEVCRQIHLALKL
jgi:ribosomal protein S18 acetylase RimI-like enzyme